LIVIRRLDFANGWTIDIHDEGRDGQTYYQRWAPGVVSQGFFSDLGRMDTQRFNDEIAKFPHTLVLPQNAPVNRLGTVSAEQTATNPREREQKSEENQ